MKENTEFSKLDLEGLKKKEKALNISLKVLIGMMIMMVLAGIYLFTKQGFSVFTILPVAFLPILMTNIKNVKKIREMIAEREK
jgi:TctA family transporter